MRLLSTQSEGEMEKSISIFVISFDGYSDVWPVFFECKERFWNDCPYITYLVTNNKDCNEKCFVIKTGEETNWCDRVLKALDSVKEDAIIVLLEDYLIGSKINNEHFNNYVDFFQNGNANYLRLINIPRKHKSSEYDEIYPILKNEEYGISLQPAIWDKQYFKDVLLNVEGNRSAWEFEIYLLKKCTDECIPISGCYGTKTNVLDIHNGVLKGKWFKNEVSYFRQKGILINTYDRGILKDKEYRSHLIRRTIRETLPPSIRKKIKRVLMKMNFKFVSNA